MLLWELHSQLCLESHRKIRCKFFIRGHCPFRSECIYLHELPARQLLRHRRQRPRMPAVSGVAHPGAGLGTKRPWLILPPLCCRYSSLLPQRALTRRMKSSARSSGPLPWPCWRQNFTAPVLATRCFSLTSAIPTEPWGPCWAWVLLVAGHISRRRKHLLLTPAIVLGWLQPWGCCRDRVGWGSSLAGIYGGDSGHSPPALAQDPRVGLGWVLGGSGGIRHPRAGPGVPGSREGTVLNCF